MMALKHVNNELTELFHQNENLQTQRLIVTRITSTKAYKNNSNGIKYGLSELSNDKTYLETELPARKRLKSEIELFDTAKHSNIICKAVVDEDFSNFINEEKYSSEISNILSNEQGFKNNSLPKELTRYDLHTQSESIALKSDKLKLDSNESTECTFEKKLENHEFKLYSENDLQDNFDNDSISNRDVDNEIEFDDEVSKCCKLLNLDVPRLTLVSTIGTKIANVEINETHKCEIGNRNNKSLDTLNSKLITFEGSLKTTSNEINLKTFSLGKRSKMQDELQNKNEKDHESNLDFKDGRTSSFPLTTFNTNKININDTLFHNEIKVNIDEAPLESEFRDNDKNNSTFKINNVLDFCSTSVSEQIILNSDRIQNCDIKDNREHLDLTIENTLNSDTSKLKEINQNITQYNLNVNKDEIDRSSAIDDSDDVLSLYVESDIDFDGTEEEIETNPSESAISEQREKVTPFLASQGHDKLYAYTDEEVKKEGNFSLNENINPDVNHPLDDKNFESHILDGVSNNDCVENKNDFNIKVDESFISDYEISLLEDTDSILSDESLDSEYEISLLEDDINDVENQNDLHENKCDTKADSNNSSICTENEKMANEESFDSEYELSLLEEDENDLHENKTESNVSSKYLPNDNKKDEKTTHNAQLFEKEINKVISKNEIYSKSISEKYASSTNTIMLSKFQKNNETVGKTDSNLKTSTNREEMQTFSKTKSSEDTHENTEDFKPITIGKKIQRLGKPENLTFEKLDVIKEPSENTNDPFLLKPEIHNESRTSNKVVLNSNELQKSEEKAAIVNKIKHLVDGACTNITTKVKFEKMEPGSYDVGKLKQNINVELQPSNKEVLNRKMSETRKPEEKVIIAIANKQLPEKMLTDKATAEKTVKTDLSVSTNGESKQDVKDIIPDYYEEEKEDLINPGWNKIKELSTDEERYQQVRNCWQSINVPNPFKNLTYYSYRKRNINGEDNTHKKRQHKRHATSNLNEKDAKRSRSCTYIFDDRIKSIEKEKEIKTKTLDDKMSNEVKRLNDRRCQEEMGINQFYGYNFDPRRQCELSNLWRDYQLSVQSVSDDYKQQIHDWHTQYTSEINKLKNNRDEILQFYNFYKGLNKDEYEDPTILTNAQMQELEEIENIYNQMDLHYK